MESRFRYGFISLLVIVFVMILVTGYLINQKLNESFESINFKKKQEPQISLSKTIYQRLLENENLVYAFNLTKNNQYLSDYYDLNYEVNKKINVLLSKNRDYDAAHVVDSFIGLVKTKQRNMSQLLIIQNQYRVNETLALLESKTKNLKQIQLQQTTRETSNESKKKRLFNRKKQQDKTLVDEKTLLDQEINKRNFEIYNLKSDFEDIKKIQGEQEITNNRREFELITSNRKIMLDLSHLILNLEIKEREKLALQTKKAREASSEIKGIIFIFSMLSTLLLITALFFIIRFIIRNNEYKRYLRKAREESDKLAETKAKFLATMSHEIRTPLNAILGFSEQLHQRDFHDEKLKEQVEIIHHSANYLSQIINDVLDYSKIEFDKMSLNESSFDLEKEVNEVVRILEQSALEKQNKLQVKLLNNVPKQLSGDVIKFKQILFNLIGNAIKFTENGSIVVEQLSGRSEGNLFFFKFQIIDTGLGISKEFISKVFDEFEQDISQHNSKTIGTGLGLAICKKMLHLMSGTIAVESELKKGTRFIIELPFKMAAESTEALTETPIKKLSKHILIVDDEPYNRKLLRAIFDKLGCTSDEAENGYVALELSSSNHYDYAFVDMKMPEMNGVELALKLQQKNNNIPLVAITATELTSEEKQHFHHLIPKPLKESDLITFFDTENKLEVEEQKPKTNLYDLKELYAMSNGDTVFFKDMIETFIRSSKDGLMALNTAFETMDRREITEQAHKMSAPCKHLHATEIYNMLKKLEKNEKELNDVELKALVLNLNTLVSQLITELEQER